jgi:hypothetical protein
MTENAKVNPKRVSIVRSSIIKMENVQLAALLKTENEAIAKRYPPEEIARCTAAVDKFRKEMMQEPPSKSTTVNVTPCDSA